MRDFVALRPPQDGSVTPAGTILTAAFSATGGTIAQKTEWPGGFTGAYPRQPGGSIKAGNPVVRPSVPAGLAPAVWRAGQTALPLGRRPVGRPVPVL